MLLAMTHDKPCPLCAANSGATQQVDICGNCHAGLHISGALPVRVTGEFQAVSDPLLDAHLQAAAKARETEASCCWCNKAPSEVRKMLSKGDYHICNECVSLCADILQMELGENFGQS